MPKMKHPDARRQIDVADTSVHVYESQGWAVVKAPKKAPAKAPARRPSEPDPAPATTGE